MFNYKDIDIKYKLLCLLFLIVYTILIQNVFSLLFVVFIYYLITNNHINGCYCILYLFILIGIMINEFNNSISFLKTGIILYFVYYSIESIDLNIIRNYIIKSKLKISDINNDLDIKNAIYIEEELRKINTNNVDLNTNYHEINKIKLEEINYLRFGMNGKKCNKNNVRDFSYILSNVCIIIFSFFLG